MTNSDHSIDQIFNRARIRLTLWYMLIIYSMLAFITIAAILAQAQAFAIIDQTVQELGRGIVFNVALGQAIASFKQYFIRNLLIFDVLLAAAATLASYILSGRTLRPIQVMVEQQQQFAADASHELRTPLTNMTLEIAAFQQTRKLPIEQKQLLDSLMGETKRMSGIVAGLLRLIQVDHQEAYFEPADLVEVVQSVYTDMSPRFKQSKRQLVITTPSHPIYTLGQADELRQLLLILTENALLYSAEKSTTAIKLSPNQQKINLTVHNIGPAIPAGEIGRVFQRFYRGSQAAAPGTGLGLAIAKSIVQHHHGSIAVASHAQKGTTFKVELNQYQSVGRVGT